MAARVMTLDPGAVPRERTPIAPGARVRRDGLYAGGSPLRGAAQRRMGVGVSTSAAAGLSRTRAGQGSARRSPAAAAAGGAAISAPMRSSLAAQSACTQRENASRTAGSPA